MSFSPPALFYKFAYLALRAYWFVFRPETFGVRCLIECGGKILLIRHTYGSTAWTLPGGGLRRNERPEQAARREVLEEVGIMIPPPAFVGEYSRVSRHRRDHVKCYHAEVRSPAVLLKKNEIREAAWFEPGRLPERLSPDAEAALRLRAGAQNSSAPRGTGAAGPGL